MKRIIFTVLTCFVSIALNSQVRCNAEQLIMIINTDNLDQEWHNNNDKYVCQSTIDNTNMSCRNYCLIDMRLLSNDGIDVDKWLTENQNNICFRDSYPFIRNAHSISLLSTDIREIERAINNKDFFGYNFMELEQKIKDYQNDRYGEYIVLKKNLFGNVGIKFNQSYSKGNSNFSIPFIKCLEVNHNLNASNKANCFVKFVFFEINNKINTFLILSLDGVDYYYDYSQDPTRGIMFNFRNYLSPR